MKNIAILILALSAALAVPAARADETNEVTGNAQDAVARALEYLRRTQGSNGAWKADVGYKLNYGYSVTGSECDHVGVTALAGMAFLAGGNLPGRGKYGAQVHKALEFVLASEKDGFVTSHGTRMYSHAFATLFLAEIYGQTANPRVRVALKRAVKLIVDSQNVEGGWRYTPLAQDSDMSIVVCQVQALRAARNVGISVPVHVIEKAKVYVRKSGQSNGSFRYQTNPQMISRESFALTAAGVTALQGTAEYSSAMIEQGLDYIRAHKHERYGSYFFYYGHYYAVQAMYVAGMKWPHYWKDYYPYVRNRLVEVQNPDGSWENRIGPGTSFATAMGALILQIPYRYLPIFQR